MKFIACVFALVLSAPSFIAEAKKYELTIPGNQPKGVFRVGSDLYFSNGEGAYCKYTGAHDLQRCGAASLKRSVLKVVPPEMRNDGMCKCTQIYPKGVMLVNGVKYYSNGENAYCKYKAPQNKHIRECGAHKLKVKREKTLPPGMSNDGECAPCK